MNFLLKIVEGPNKGAEIALVEGVAVTLGKGDDCDIVLADATLPADPISIEASSSGVTVDGAPLEMFHVKTVGSTSFASGPADAAWGELVWGKSENGGTENGERGTADAGSEEPTASRVSRPTPSNEHDGKPQPKKRRGCLGCLWALVLVFLAIAILGFFFRDMIKDADWRSILVRCHGEPRKSGRPAVSGQPLATVESLASKYGLSVAKGADGAASLSGNFKTRRERLAAAAEVYAAHPGVELDFSDDESFRAAAEDALFTLTEGALKVSQATNRSLVVGGSVKTPASLEKALRALNSDLPKLRNVDVKDVRFSAPAAVGETEQDENGIAVASVARGRARKAATKPEFPVCGILTAPYPCLVMKNGARVLEGASVGGFVVEKIEADSVTVTNSTGRFTWRP